MKKYLSILALVAVASSALAQGKISYASPSASILVRSNDTAAAVNVPANTSFLGLLWAAPGTAASAYAPGTSLASWLTANPGWSLVPNVAKPVTLAGRLLATETEVPNANPMDLISIGWIGGAGSTFDQSAAAGLPVGMSAKFGPIDPEAPGSTTPNPNTANFGFSGLTMVTAVPEPSTFALAGLGAAAMLIFRRRK